MAIPDDWAIEACTLPTSERPLRMAEFDDLFGHVQRSTRHEPTRLNLVMPSDIETAARDLARRESDCCSFFRFEFSTADDEFVMRIAVPPAHVEVLDAIEERVAGR